MSLAARERQPRGHAEDCFSRRKRRPEVWNSGSHGAVSFLDGNQQPIGFDIKLAMAVAQELGMKLEVILYDFGNMIPALAADEVDMIGACITITEERAREVLFSEPYYTGGIAAMVAE